LKWLDQTLIHDLYIHRVAESWTNEDPWDDDGVKLGHTRTTYGASGPCRHLPAQVQVTGANPYAWDTARGDPAEFTYVRSAAVYGSFCQPVRTCAGDLCTGNPLGQAWVTYDPQYGAFPIAEAIDTSGPGTTGTTPSATLTTSATWYAEYGAIATATDPSGLTTSVTLDHLGRPTRMYGPGCAEP